MEIKPTDTIGRLGLPITEVYNQAGTKIYEAHDDLPANSGQNSFQRPSNNIFPNLETSNPSPPYPAKLGLPGAISMMKIASITLKNFNNLFIIFGSKRPKTNT